MAALIEVQMVIQVKCYSGYRGEETPRAIQLSDRTVEIETIVDRWLAPDHRYFKILGDDDATYIIRHELTSWTWELTFYRDKKAPAYPTVVFDNPHPGRIGRD